MITPTIEQLRAISVLKQNAEFKHVLQWITKSLTDQSIQNNRTEGEGTRIVQGRNQELQDILAHIENAEALYKEKTKTPQGFV